MRKVELPNDILLSGVRQMIEEGHTVTIRVKGNSMRPFLEGERDSVVLSGLNSGSGKGELKEKDVILAEIAPGTYVLHRVIGIDGDTITLMGDGNLRGKERCRTEDIAGIVTTLIRNGREIDCRSRKMRRYSGIWIALRPMRRLLLVSYRVFTGRLTNRKYKDT